MSKVVGCVPYINALPLISCLPKGVSLKLANPSELPPLLESGQANAILVSSIDSIRTPNRKVVRKVGIASDGEAQSVRLFSKVPFSQIKRLALDSSSMTSNALAQIWLRSFNDNDIQTEILSPDLEGMFEWADAAVLIGDNGIRAVGGGLLIKDLGVAWTEMTDLPFVWALWTGNETLSPELAEALRSSVKEGIRIIPLLAKEASRRTGLTHFACQRYFTTIMRYRLNDLYEEGLNEFANRLKANNLVADTYEMNWV